MKITNWLAGLLMLLAFAEASAQEMQLAGWRHEDANPLGNKHYDHPTTRETADEFTRRFSLELEAIENNHILTADVSKEPGLEILTVQQNRLYVISASGKKLQSTIVDIEGIPKSYLTLAADADGDGLADIGVAYRRGANNYGKLYAAFYNAEGQLIKEFTKGSVADGTLAPRGLKNGKCLIVQGSGYSRNPRGFSFWDMETATEDWYYDVGPSTGPVSFVDANKDGKLEITGHLWTPHNGAIGESGRKTVDYALWCIVVNEAGEEVFTKLYPDRKKGRIMHHWADFEQDSTYDILAREEHPKSYPGVSQLHILEGETGHTLFTFSGMRGKNTGWDVSICDLNDNSEKEILASNYKSGAKRQLYLFDKRLSVLKQVTMPGILEATADIRGKGRTEIVLRDGKTVKVLDAGFTQVLSYEARNPVRKVLVTDLDGNQINELILLTHEGIEVIEPKGI